MEHAVPLSVQAVAILREAAGLTGDGRYVFPSIRSRFDPMSENTVNAALRRLGYTGDEMTAHGFRSTASTLLNESGKWSPDAIERALAHKGKDLVRPAATIWGSVPKPVIASLRVLGLYHLYSRVPLPWVVKEVRFRA